jgi:hypothetical protein
MTLSTSNTQTSNFNPNKQKQQKIIKNRQPKEQHRSSQHQQFNKEINTGNVLLRC